MSFNIGQALLIVKHWQNGRASNAVQEEFEQQDDVKREQEQRLPDVDTNRKNAEGVREETKKIIMNSYARGATPERISKIGKIPLSTVRQVIAKGNV